MTTNPRSVLRHGAIQLLLAFCTGFGAAASSAPHRRAWLSVHLIGILAAFFCLFVGLVGKELVLGPRATRVLFGAVLVVGYGGLALGVFQAALGYGGPVAVPGAPPAGVVALVNIVGLAVLISLALTATVLLIIGLGREKPQPT